MKELLYIPTATIIRWLNTRDSDYSCKDSYVSFGYVCHEDNFERAINEITTGLYSEHFYIRNNIPFESMREEFEIIDI